MQDVLNEISNARSWLGDVDDALRDAESMLEDLDELHGDASVSVIEAVKLGLPMIEYRYGLSSKEAAEIREFISKNDKP